jgi:threonine dehydrogenase-like Zn-dependent dehydrogenase
LVDVTRLAFLGGGRLVAITGGRGSYAEYAAVDAAMMTAVPDGLPATDAVAMAASGAMAFGLARKAGLRGGETVLVEGGSGEIGGYLVPWARILLYGTLSGEPAVIDATKIRERGEMARPTIEAVLPLVDAAEAHRRLETGPTSGRILLVP